MTVMFYDLKNLCKCLENIYHSQQKPKLVCPELVFNSILQVKLKVGRVNKMWGRFLTLIWNKTSRNQ